MVIAKPPYPPVGQCIYCGAVQHSPGRLKLGDEHIVPQGLGGNIVLPEASCGECEGMTTKFEGYCQKVTLAALRYQLGMPTKRPKDRPTHLPVKLLVDNEWTNRDVPVNDFPLNVFAPIFRLPGLLDGPDRPPGGGKLRFFAAEVDAQDRKTRLLAKEGATHIETVTQIRIDKFGKMLAKIAHSFTVASYGLGNFKPLLLKTIDGTESDPTQYVGGNTAKPPESKHLHTLGIGWTNVGDKEYIVVNIQLFAKHGLPVYYLVAGERLTNPAE
jgi:hypothetical protein